VWTWFRVTHRTVGMPTCNALATFLKGLGSWCPQNHSGRGFDLQIQTHVVAVSAVNLRQTAHRLGEVGLHNRQALLDLFDAIGTGRNVILQFDQGWDRPLVFLKKLEYRFDGRIRLAPG
jgi:hypothetical protein